MPRIRREEDLDGWGKRCPRPLQSVRVLRITSLLYVDAKHEDEGRYLMHVL